MSTPEILPQPTTPELARLPLEIPIADNALLRRIQPTDIDALFDILARNPDTKQHIAWAAKVTTREDMLPSLVRYSDANLNGRFAIVANETVVGAIHTFPGQQPDEYGIGYLLDTVARGNGYISRAVAVLIEQLADLLRTKHVYLQIKPDNADSIAVAIRLGFTPAEKVMGVDFPCEQYRYRLEL